MSTLASLIDRLQRDLSDVTFVEHLHVCAWDADARHIYYTPHTSAAELLHEAAHALLGHHAYTRDIELLRIEREAWTYATDTLAIQYGTAIDEETVEAALDTYREWLHRRSLCPSCQQNGIQQSSTTYRCLHCHDKWQVNEARTCRLRRTRLAA